MREARRIGPVRLTVCLVLCGVACLSAGAEHFKVGFAQCEITPADPVPMWGYGDRHALLSQGVKDPLFAKALVIDVGSDKLALVGLDLGRGPTAPMMVNIRKAVLEASGVNYVMICGSHTHHGPVIELKDEPGKGQGKFDASVAYAKTFEQKVSGVINEAAGKVEDAKLGWASKDVDYNRNRHTKFKPKPVDPELAVLRFDKVDGAPIAVLVNYAAHPTNLDEMDLRFSSEYPGYLTKTVEAEVGAPCMFMQGATGDLSCKGDGKSMEEFGATLGGEVLEILKGVETKAPEKPSLKGKVDAYAFDSRVDVANPIIRGIFGQAFFPELLAIFDELPDGKVHPELTTVVVNGNLALVGGSGEFFCDHATRLKARSRLEKTLFFGYCNGHHMYFPTIEATSEGGYGADPTVSWVALGAGEEMMNQALINIYTMTGAYDEGMLGF